MDSDLQEQIDKVVKTVEESIESVRFNWSGEYVAWDLISVDQILPSGSDGGWDVYLVGVPDNRCDLFEELEDDVFIKTGKHIELRGD